MLGPLACCTSLAHCVIARFGPMDTEKMGAFSHRVREATARVKGGSCMHGINNERMRALYRPVVALQCGVRVAHSRCIGGRNLSKSFSSASQFVTLLVTRIPIGSSPCCFLNCTSSFALIWNR
jgi:hypothetical protein